MAATVSNPRGGLAAFLETNFRACLKLQYVSGYSGLINRTLMRDFFYVFTKNNARTRGTKTLGTEGSYVGLPDMKWDECISPIFITFVFLCFGNEIFSLPHIL
jgi:hypothetical protein